MSTREQVEAEAVELYPAPRNPYTPHEAFQERAAHIRAKTITAEQVEAAAEAVWSESDWTVTPRLPWKEWAKDSPIPAERLRRDARVAFRAAGFLIEGDNDE